MPYFALLTNGTRGDFQPFLTLARALQGAGHRVVLVGPQNDAAAATRCGVPFVAYNLDFQQLVTGAEARRALRRGGRLEMLHAFLALEREHGADVGATLRAVVAEADALVAHYLLLNWAQPLAEAFGLPLVPVVFQPLTPRTAARANILLSPDFSFGPALNSLSHHAADATWWLLNRRRVSAWRRALGLGAARESIAAWLHRTRPPVLHGYSTLLAPPPADWWPANTVTGAWLPDTAIRAALFDASAASAPLELWLAESAVAPVYLGFGSLPVLEYPALERYTRTINEGLGRRVLAGAGWSDLPTGRVHAGLFVADALDHSVVFPRCAAIVHHGGAGTTHAALHAGRPAVVCSVFADQLFWGRAVEQLGAGLRLPYRRLNPPRLMNTLKQVLEPGITGRAEALRPRFAAETGVEAAVAALNALF